MRQIDTGIAIVGAGPAGSAAAALLSMKGLDVTLVERDTFPRDKLCGEFLSWDAEPVLDLLEVSAELDRAGSRQVRGCRIVAPGRQYTFPLPGTARGISRVVLDRVLFDRAAQLGARCLTGHTVTRIEPSASPAFLLASGPEGEVTIRAERIVGGWGRWGRMDLQLRRSFATERQKRFFGFKRHYSEVAPSDEVRLYSFAGGYLGVSPVENGTTNICGLVHQRRIGSMKGGWPALVEELSGESAELASLFASHSSPAGEFISSEPVIFNARRAEHDGALMIGDAAGLVDPLAGNGMTVALQSALLLATSIVRTREPVAAGISWDREFSRFFHPRFRWSRLVAALLERPALISMLLRFAISPAPGRFLTRHTRARIESVETMVRNFRQL